MKLNSKGQVTIPADLRRTHGFVAGDEVEVVADGAMLRIVHADSTTTRGADIVARMRGRATTAQTTDELMALLRAPLAGGVPRGQGLRRVSAPWGCATVRAARRTSRGLSWSRPDRR